jgi:hypothetical protein
MEGGRHLEIPAGDKRQEQGGKAFVVGRFGEFGIVYSLDDGNRSFLSPDPSRTYLGSMQMKVGWLYTEDVLLVKTV